MINKIQSFIVEKLEKWFCTYHIEDTNNSVYLTFDDGPEEEVTQQILEILEKYNAKATFFCCGHNIIKNEYLYNEINRKGHSIGGHTINHIKGIEESSFKYIKEVITFKSQFKSRLFRPPYMSLSLIECIFLLFSTKIILWSVDSEDWCIEKKDKINVEDMINNTKPGSIVLFHFSQEHMARTLQILPLYMKGMSERGYVFKSIKE